MTALLKTEAHNRDMKREVAGDTKGADCPTQPPKKLKTEEIDLPAAQSEVVKNSGWRRDTSKMFSCSLCQYHTPDEKQIMEHFNSDQHKDVVKHLFTFFPQHRLDFLHEYFLYMKDEISRQRKKSKLPPIIDKFEGIGQEHYLHRIQAAHCRACDVLIPDDPELLTAHITSNTHKQKCGVTFESIKLSSYDIAKELFLHENVLPIFKRYIKKRKPIREIVASLSQGNCIDDVLVAAENDIIAAEEEDGDDEDSIADAKPDPEVPGNHNENSIADTKPHPEVPGNHNKDSIAEAKAHPAVPGNHNKDTIVVAKVDPEVPVVHKQGPAHEDKAAAQNAEKQQVINQPQSSGAAAVNPQKQQVINRPQSSGAADKNPQKQQVINQPPSSGGENPQQPNPPAASRPASSTVTPTSTRTGDMKKSEAAGKIGGASGPTAPNQKLSTSNQSGPLERPKIVKNDRFRVGLMFMYSCSLCQYHTPDDTLGPAHLRCGLHKQIRKHLCNVFSEQKVDFLHKCIMYKIRKTAMDRKILNIKSFNDSFTGIVNHHFMHRIQAVHCQACDIVIPDVRSHYQLHIESKDHQKRRKTIVKDIKLSSLAEAEGLFQDVEVCRLLKEYEQGKNPFQHLTFCSSQVSSSGEVQVDDIDMNDEDSIADDSDDSEVPAHETEDSHNKRFPPDEPKTIAPATSSTTINIGGAIQEEETDDEEEEMAAEAP